MRKPKFKVGDKLVVSGFPIGESISPGQWSIGDEIVVYDVISTYTTVFYRSTEGKSVLFEEELEFEDVYNSPLYKAMI